MMTNNLKELQNMMKKYVTPEAFDFVGICLAEEFDNAMDSIMKKNS